MFQTSFWLSSESPRHTIRPEDDAKELHHHSQTEQKEFLVGKQITPNCPGLSSIVSTQYSNISFLYLNIRFLSSSEKKKTKQDVRETHPILQHSLTWSWLRPLLAPRYRDIGSDSGLIRRQRETSKSQDVTPSFRHVSFVCMRFTSSLSPSSSWPQYVSSLQII